MGYNLRSRTTNGQSKQPATDSTSYSTMKEARSRVQSPPSMRELNQQVQAVLSNASWWDWYGVDWCIIMSAVAMVPVGVLLLRCSEWGPFLLGLGILSLVHGMLATKMAHLAAHNALCDSKRWSSFWQILFIEFFGSFSAVSSMDIHLKVHHPYTNIIGLGDSSLWRVPFLPCFIYMFVAPLLLPALTPVVAIASLLSEKQFKATVRCFIVIMCGLVANVWCIMWAANMTCLKAILCILVYRAPMEIPYIHVNIFQHLGLPMYAKDNHPPRIHLMCSGALNLTRAPILDYLYGHSLIDCHVEHHLFPNLSDNMCAKVKPLVKQYALSHGLPYQEQDYWDRLKLFINKYKEIMVNAPPITDFIGVQ